MLAHGIGRDAGIGKPDRLRCGRAPLPQFVDLPPVTGVISSTRSVYPLAPQQRFAGSPRPAESPPDNTWAGPLLSSLAGATPGPRSDEALRATAALMREQIADLRADRDHWRDQAQRLARRAPRPPRLHL